jgi:hypothetical protein
MKSEDPIDNLLAAVRARQADPEAKRIAIPALAKRDVAALLIGAMNPFRSWCEKQLTKVSDTRSRRILVNEIIGAD